MPGIEVAGAVNEPSGLVATACSVPRFRPKSAGANGLTCTLIGADAVPRRVTTTLAGPGLTPQGTCAVIWPLETNASGAAVPAMVTEFTSSSVVERGVELAMESALASPLPNIDMREPGATMVLWPEPAALTTPLACIVWAKPDAASSIRKPTIGTARVSMLSCSQKSR